MARKRSTRQAAVCVALFGLLAVAAPAWAASREKVLHGFDGTDGAYPYAGLSLDWAGSLYGTTSQGGSEGKGNVFKLTPGANGRWTETVLHSFTGSDGYRPLAGVIFDDAGNLYGTTYGPGNGLVFKLAPNQKSKWTETVLYTFRDSPDGTNPATGLVFDGSGNLYGTTQYGGNGYCTTGCGVLFRLAPGARGHWNETVLHNFDYLKDGAFPAADLTFESAGNLYGTLPVGGYSNGLSCSGAVYSLEAPEWTETVLHCFDSNDPNGAAPFASVIFDKAGNLYGTTSGGGGYVYDGGFYTGCGVLFKLSTPKQKGGAWKEKVLHSFTGGTDGARPGDLILDASGNLYGRAKIGGNLNDCKGHGCGAVFENMP